VLGINIFCLAHKGSAALRYTVASHMNVDIFDAIGMVSKKHAQHAIE
jgi:hypothetical protein